MSAEAAGQVITVEVAWSPAPRELLQAVLALPGGATVAAALEAAGWPGLESARQGDAAFGAAGLSAAVWSRPCALGHVLREGDRVEVLRSLVVAPMDARRARFDAAGGVRALRKRGASGRKD